MDTFQAFYNNLYNNPGTVGGKADDWHDQMPEIATDRGWGAPKLHELLRAVRDLKNAAPGMSGVPAIMWRAILRDKRLQTVVLNIMEECWRTETVPSEWLVYLVYYMTVPRKRVI